MRELALVTLKIVDETTQLQPEEAEHLYTPDFTDHMAVNNMDRLLAEPPVADAVMQTAEGAVAFRPTSEMTVVRIEPCNPDSVLGAMMAANELSFVSQFIAKIGKAGMRLLDAENDNRSELDRMSKTLGGDGVERTDMVQFYAVFSVAVRDDALQSVLEGVLRLDRIDMAIDEAVML